MRIRKLIDSTTFVIKNMKYYKLIASGSLDFIVKGYSNYKVDYLSALHTKLLIKLQVI